MYNIFANENACSFVMKPRDCTVLTFLFPIYFNWHLSVRLYVPIKLFRSGIIPENSKIN